MKKYLSYLAILFLYQSSYAQFFGKISGNVIENRQSIELATVGLAKMPDSSKIIYYTTTDSLGKFYFEKLSFGNYILKISLVGYKTFQKQITLSENQLSLSLKNIELYANNQLLKEVQVTAQKNQLQKTSNGFIINAKDNISQAGGTATDLLRNTPTVDVDAEGTITVRGKTPLVLINGRHSTLANTDRIPASSVETIEIINNPSAQYDAEAEG